MTKKFTRFLSITAVFSVVAAAGFVLYKKLKDHKSFIQDDFDELDDLDDYDDDFEDLDSENRGYTSIKQNTEEETEETLSDTLTNEEKEALTSDLNQDEKDTDKDATK